MPPGHVTFKLETGRWTEVCLFNCQMKYKTQVFGLWSGRARLPHNILMLRPRKCQRKIYNDRINEMWPQMRNIELSKRERSRELRQPGVQLPPVHWTYADQITDAYNAFATECMLHRVLLCAHNTLFFYCCFFLLFFMCAEHTLFPSFAVFVATHYLIPFVLYVYPYVLCIYFAFVRWQTTWLRSPSLCVPPGAPCNYLYI